MAVGKVNVVGISIPVEFKNQTWQLQKPIPNGYPQYDSQCSFTINGNTLMFVKSGGSTVYKYNCITGAVTDIGFATSNKAMNLCANDGGSIIYSVDKVTGIVHYFENNTWHSTEQVASVPYQDHTCVIGTNPSGDELYFVKGNDFKKWNKQTGTATILKQETTYMGNQRPPLSWTDDNSVWVISNDSKTIKKISTIDGSVLTQTPQISFAGTASFTRYSTYSRAGILVNNTTGSNWYVYLVNQDGTWTQYIEVNSYEAVYGSKTGKIVGCNTSFANTYIISFNNMNTIRIVNGGGITVTEDASRLCSGTYMYSFFLYK